MAHSPYTEAAVEYVARNPGCSKWDLAKHLTLNPRRCPSKQYYLVNTQIRLGNVVALRAGRAYALYLPRHVKDLMGAEGGVSMNNQHLIGLVVAIAENPAGLLGIFADALEEAGKDAATLRALLAAGRRPVGYLGEGCQYRFWMTANGPAYWKTLGEHSEESLKTLMEHYEPCFLPADVYDRLHAGRIEGETRFDSEGGAWAALCRVFLKT